MSNISWMIIIVPCVDELIVAVSNLESVNDIKSNLSQNFKMKHFSQLSAFVKILLKEVKECI